MNIINIYDKSLYYIGGIVRDELLGIKSIDIDITYVGNAIEYCSKFGETIQVNEKFGTIKIKKDENIIDFASTRTEIYNKKGHLPTITNIGCSLKEDVMRRDFTINALAMNTKTHEIIDYVNGQKDLKNKLLRVLHDESFIDDPTRIVRGLKFRTRFGFELENHTKNLQNQYLNNINYDISYKRLKKELIETFNLNSQKAFKIFVTEKIYKLVSPKEFNLPKINIENLLQKYKVKNIWLVYIGLLPDISNLPLTKSEQKIIDDYKKITTPKNDFETYKMFHNLAPESILLYGISNNKIKIIENYFDNLKNIKLSINGNDLKNLNIPASKEYQKIFDMVLKEKIKNPEMNKQDEINYIKKRVLQ